MKNLLFSFILLLSISANAQINLIDHFENLCAVGESVIIEDSKIHIAGTRCIDLGNNQFVFGAFTAKYDLLGNLELYSIIGDTIKAYEAESIVFDTQNNQYIIGDFSRDSLGNNTNNGIFIQKRDSNGNILWFIERQDTLSNVNYEVLGASMVDDDKIAVSGTYIPNGEFIQTGVPELDILFMLFDTSGTLLEKKRIGDNLSQETGHEVIQYTPNELVIASVKNFPGAQSKNWVLKVDYQGNVLDEYISTSSLRGGVWDLVKTKDGGIACASLALNGLFPGIRAKSYVEKLDSNLNQVWDYTIDDTFRDWNYAFSIAENSNGQIYVGGAFQGYGIDPDSIGEYGYLQKLSSNGDSIWYKNYYYYDNVTWDETQKFYDITIYDDNIYMVGEANDFNNPNPPGQSMWLVSTDSNGVINSIPEEKYELGVKLYPNPATDYFTIEIQEKQGSSYQLEIYNINGRLIKQKQLNQAINVIETSNWSKGLFIYRLSNSDGEIRGKIIVD